MGQMSLSLYSLTGRFYDLMARAAADESLSDAELEEQYNELSLLLQAKTPGVVAYYRNVEANINAVDAEIDRLTQLKNRVKKHRDNYKEYVKGCMERLNIVELSTDLGKLRIAKNPVSVEVADVDAVPDEYVESVLTIRGDRSKIQLLLELAEADIDLMGLKAAVTETVDKKKIAEQFKETGEVVDGIILHTDNTRLEFK
jgi:hypothetical protein